jgi:predicted transcriptional regulator
MVMEIIEIKEVRKQLGLTQSQLAKISGVSQSLIAKIEASKLDPTYSNAQKIFSALHNYRSKEEVKANQIMSEKISSISPSASIKEAIAKMKNHGFSQLPVISDHKAIGIITESIILDSMLKNKGKKVEDIMGSAPPIIAYDTSVEAVSNLLKHFQTVLVSKKGKLVGVITKTDLLAKVYTKKKR